MNPCWKLLPVAVAAVVAGGALPASAHTDHPPAVRRCDLSASRTASGWTGTVTMSVSDPAATAVRQTCWLQSGSTPVAGSETTCVASGSSGGTAGSCRVHVAFGEPGPDLRYCVEVTWNAGGAGHHFSRCTRGVRVTYTVPADVRALLDEVGPLPVPEELSAYAGVTGTGGVSLPAEIDVRA